MNDEIARIQDQLHRTFQGDAWHGDSVRSILNGVSAAEACRRPLEAAHTIWEIVHHMRVWKDIASERLRGKPATAEKPEEDWPPVRDTTEEAWKKALTDLEASQKALGEVVSGLSEEALDRSPIEGYSTAYVLIHGVIQHDLYHAGQIALLKKALGGRR